MNIEIWSDYACPYCYIGKRQLELALAKFPHANDVYVTYKTFELYPNAGLQSSTTTQGRIERKYGKTPEQAQHMIDSIIALGARVDLDMRYYTVRNTNTFDAHRLTKFAEFKGKGKQMNERLFHAYFTDNLELADHNVLIKIAADVGLDTDETQAMLSSTDYAAAAREDEIRAKETDVNSLPYFVIDGKQALVGSQPAANWLATLEHLWAENLSDLNASGASCGIDGCEIA